MSQKANHIKRRERRAKFLSNLTPKERLVRDDYVAWVRWWKKEYTRLSLAIRTNKTYIRTTGRNAPNACWIRQRLWDKQRLQARTMLLARHAGRIEYRNKTELKPESL